MTDRQDDGYAERLSHRKTDTQKDGHAENIKVIYLRLVEQVHQIESGDCCAAAVQLLCKCCARSVRLVCSSCVTPVTGSTESQQMPERMPLECTAGGDGSPW